MFNLANQKNIIKQNLERELSRKLKWLLFIRFSLFFVVGFAVIFSKTKTNFIYWLLGIYGLTTASYLFALISRRMRSTETSFKFICSIPLALEIIVEIALVLFTGGVESPYLFLIAVSIATAAFIYKLTGTLIVTTYASTLFSFFHWAEYTGLFDLTPTESIVNADTNGEVLFFRVFFNVCLYYIIAFLSGYLSRKLHTQISRIKTLDDEILQVKLATSEIMDQLTTGVLVIDNNHYVTYFNTYAQEVLGFNWKIDQQIDIFRKLQNDFPEIHNILFDYIDNKVTEPKKHELTIGQNPKISRRKVEIKLTISNLKVKDTIRGYVVVLEDISSEKMKQSLMEEMKKLSTIGDISARFAHEIRNPLASIRGSVEMLMGNIHLPPEDKRLFQLVIRESDRLTNLLEDFLAFARIRELPNEQFTNGTVDVGKLFDEILLFCSSHPAYKSAIFIDNKLNSGEVIVRGQDEQLGKAFMNIVINSFQAFSEEGGILEIDKLGDNDVIFPDQDMIGISICDNAKGMSDEELENLFTPFVSHKKFGVGLGMAIAHSVISKHNGMIKVESEKGKGTCFTIYLENANVPSKFENIK